MKAQAKKLFSLTLAILMLFAAFGAATVSAANDGKVHVVIKNDKFSVADTAAWEGVLIDEWVALQDSDSAESVLLRTLQDNGYDYQISNYGYISSVNGLSEFDNNNNGGWMTALNDWFTSDSVSAYTVANGGLEAGDEIVMMYTNSWGADCGSLYGVLDTTLTDIVIEGATLSEAFAPSTVDYALEITTKEAEIKVVPNAYNKNYQTRTYKNEYQPEVKGAEIKRTESFSVKDGDTVYIGVGNPAWPSMNVWVGVADETVYTLKVKYAPVKGDLNGNGMLDIKDVTALQRYLADFEQLTEEQLKLADMDGDGEPNVHDVTAMQRILAGY